MTHVAWEGGDHFDTTALSLPHTSPTRKAQSTAPHSQHSADLVQHLPGGTGDPIWGEGGGGGE